jgi:hypothetical protein
MDTTIKAETKKCVSSYIGEGFGENGVGGK